jgi:23S rRNA-/tRNA-specific pseudouridylate synthase
VSRTELKILKESDFWTAVVKPPRTHSDQVEIRRGESSVFKAVHRLDFETQGLLLLAKESAVEKYRSLFLESSPASKKTEKLYLAGSEVSVPTGHYSGFIGSRYRSSKKTRYESLQSIFKGYHSVLGAEHIISEAPAGSDKYFGKNAYQVQLISGRRHQIRAFFAHFNAPLIGDILYGAKTTEKNLALFSWKLSFVDPFSERFVEVEASPELFQTL